LAVAAGVILERRIQPIVHANGVRGKRKKRGDDVAALV